MRHRFAICLLALAATACMDALEAVAPRAFYGRLVRVDDSELCLADPRDEDPERERCFLLGDAELPSGTEEGDILAVRYELGEDGEEETAVRISPVSTR